MYVSGLQLNMHRIVQQWSISCLGLTYTLESMQLPCVPQVFGLRQQNNWLLITAFIATNYCCPLYLSALSDELLAFNHHIADGTIQIPSDSQCSPNQRPEIRFSFLFYFFFSLRSYYEMQRAIIRPARGHMLFCLMVANYRLQQHTIVGFNIMCNMPATDWLTEHYLHASAYDWICML